MIKANELRIGNWVKFSNKINPDKYIQINARWFAMLAGGRPEYSMEPDEEISPYYLPISLTPEILEKCGFVNLTFFEGIPTGVYENNGLRVGLNADDFAKDQHTAIFERDIFAKVKYLHQLQNLYFALTGEELQIKGL